MSPAVEQVLADLEANRADLACLGGRHNLDQAHRACAAALRADPATGNGRRRVAQARAAAVRLLIALDAMGEDGREPQ
ncbi:MAG: hypothetical protein ACK5SX_15060 [Sandaracinobacter sp.]